MKKLSEEELFNEFIRLFTRKEAYRRIKKMLKPKVPRDWLDLWTEHLTRQDKNQVSKLLRIILAELDVEVEK